MTLKSMWLNFAKKTGNNTDNDKLMSHFYAGALSVLMHLKYCGSMRKTIERLREEILAEANKRIAKEPSARMLSGNQGSLNGYPK